jgi:small-conductance mechanosensitive channel
MNDNLDDPLYKNIYPSMQEKETDELLRIWKENDREQWSDTAFEVIHDILLERIGQLPEQAPREEVKRELEHLHNPMTLLRISSWSNILSWFILILTISFILVALFNRFLLGSLIIFLPIGLFCFLVLQAIAKSILLLLDIFNNTQQLMNAAQSQE